MHGALRIPKASVVRDIKWVGSFRRFRDTTFPTDRVGKTARVSFAFSFAPDIAGPNFTNSQRRAERVSRKRRRA